MEEDIKILEKFTNIVKGKDYNAKNGWHAYYDDELIVLGKAIENLIKENLEHKEYIRELEERNSNLNESNNLKINKINELEKENQSYRDYLGEPPCYDNAKYIPKSKIEEKIEEWDKSIKWNNADDRYYAIKILQELMEDKWEEKRNMKIV